VSYPGYPESCRLPPRPEQIEGFRALLGDPPREFRGCFALFDEVGVGKSKQVVDALCHAYTRHWTDAAIAVTPGFARSVWASTDPLLGEVSKHAWADVSYSLVEYCARRPHLPEGVFDAPSPLHVITTNYEFLRRAERLDPLIAWAKDRRTWLILDESWAVKTHNADQTRAVKRLRKVCQNVVLLNGTPGRPDEVYSQFDLMDPRIIGVKNYWAFKARYCVMGGWMGKQIVGYQRMDEFAARTKPYALQRPATCLGLDKPVYMTIEARLTPSTWAKYVAMRDELMVWLDQQDQGAVSVALQAGVRTMRLTQILAGFLGGVETEGLDLDDPEGTAAPATTREVGREKMDAVMAFLDAHPVQKAVLWCRFRPEMDRIAAELALQGSVVYLLQGQQKPDDRERTKRAFAPGAPSPLTTADAACSPERLVGHPAAGGAALNFAAAHLAIYISNGWSLKDRKQSEGRLVRPGQMQPVLFVDVVAVGPDGQRTLDHQILAALRANEDIAQWTAATWRQRLTDG